MDNSGHIPAHPLAAQQFAGDVAIAAECFICALDLLDDAEDGDQTSLQELIGTPLDNDCHDVSAYLHDDASAPSSGEKQSVKTDMQRGKKTLPVVLAATSAANMPQGRDSVQEQVEHTDDKKQEDERRALREGILTTWGICLLYRERARDCLQEIEIHTHLIAPALRLLLGV